MNYTPLEIAQIIGACQSREEVVEACTRFRYLHSHVAPLNMFFIANMSNKRIEYLKYKQN
ncbi:hypothetical protein VS868_11845 [Salinimicrobium sp. 3283s]|uniref:hypothetical protein n=1 Tax=Salinimicrobium sp. 3283s TaxID=3114359 RepID=UPI0031EDC279